MLGMQLGEAHAHELIAHTDVEGRVLERSRQTPGQRSGLSERLLPPAAPDHGRTQTDHLEGRGAPESRSGTGDDGDLAVQQAVPEDLGTGLRYGFTHPDEQPYL